MKEQDNIAMKLTNLIDRPLLDRLDKMEERLEQFDQRIEASIARMELMLTQIQRAEVLADLLGRVRRLEQQNADEGK